MPAGHALVWSDEFDVAGAPNSTRWAYDSVRGTTGVGNADGWGNNELQHYTDNRRENARVEGGVLVVEARREAFQGKNYTSARLVTHGKQSWRYGFFEVLAKVPCARGAWPAIWTLGSPRTGYTLTSWPYDGEIDVMERFNFDTSSAGLGEIIASAHTGAHNPLPSGNLRSVAIPTADLCTSFHKYQLTWTAQRVVIGVDDRNYFQYLNDGSGKYEWPFDSPQYLIMNVAVGGNWFAGGVVDDAAFPARMEVDYVRVYQAP